MNRKTFTDNREAIEYQNNLKRQGYIAIVGKLGLKFRVYSYSPDFIKNSAKIIGRLYTENDAKISLRQLSLRAENAIAEALELQKMMESYNVLKTAKAVFNFLDSPSIYDKEMKEFIDVTIDEYDYDVKEEV